MCDLGAAIGLVLTIEGLLMAGFTGSRWTRMALDDREGPAKSRGVVWAPRGRA
jgi:uncharacterized protein YjeT (DUF2065 family)